MAELLDAARKSGTWFTPYSAVLRSRMRSQRAYPLSFAADMLSSLLVGAVEFAEVWVIYHNVRVLGGLGMHAMLLLFGLSNLAFSLAQILVGHTDTLPTYIRAGTLDAFHLRQPLFERRMWYIAHRSGLLSFGVFFTPPNVRPDRFCLQTI